MEPISLFGAAIVAFGLWLELKILVKTVRGSSLLRKLVPLWQKQQLEFANRYVDHEPREFMRRDFRGQHT